VANATVAYLEARAVRPETDRERALVERLEAALLALAEQREKTDAAYDRAHEAEERAEEAESERDEADEERKEADEKARKAGEELAALRAEKPEASEKWAALVEERAQANRDVDRYGAAMRDWERRYKSLLESTDKLRADHAALGEAVRGWIADDPTAAVTSGYWREVAKTAQRDLVERTRERDEAREALDGKRRKRARKEGPR
jgi:chromosome segregation ATPase